MAAVPVLRFRDCSRASRHPVPPKNGKAVPYVPPVSPADTKTHQDLEAEGLLSVSTNGHRNNSQILPPPDRRGAQNKPLYVSMPFRQGDGSLPFVSNRLETRLRDKLHHPNVRMEPFTNTSVVST